MVITADGEVLVEPTDTELADQLGLNTTPAEDFYDFVVIGGGPAGLGAAVYGASEGLRTVLVERTATGGQAGQSSRIENYLGFPDGVSGAQLTERARRQALKFGAEMITARDVVGLEVNGSARTVRFADGTSDDAHSVILATGVSYRQLSAPGLDDVHRPRRVLRLFCHRGRAMQRAGCLHRRWGELRRPSSCLLLPVARSVTILVRGASLAASMSYYLIQQIEKNPKISVRACTEIAADGDDHLEGITLLNKQLVNEENVDTGLAVHLHRRRSADGLARRRYCRDQTWIYRRRPRPRRRRASTARVAPGPRPLPPRNQCSRGLCRR